MEAISGRVRWVKNVGVGGDRSTWGENLSRGLVLKIWKEGLALRVRRGWAARVGRVRPRQLRGGAGGRGMSLFLAPVLGLVDL